MCGCLHCWVFLVPSIYSIDMMRTYHLIRALVGTNLAIVYGLRGEVVRPPCHERPKLAAEDECAMPECDRD